MFIHKGSTMPCRGHTLNTVFSFELLTNNKDVEAPESPEKGNDCEGSGAQVFREASAGTETA